jgi:hypothetical protein
MHYMPCSERVLYASDLFCEILDRVEDCITGVESWIFGAFARFSSFVGVTLDDDCTA